MGKFIMRCNSALKAITGSHSACSRIICTILVCALCLNSGCIFSKNTIKAYPEWGDVQTPKLEEVVAANHNVIIGAVDFEPATIKIKTGDTVTWVNNDKETHTITSWRQYQDESYVVYTELGKIWDSGDIEPGGNYSRTFDTAGRFEYFSFPIYFYVEFQKKIMGVIDVSEE